MKNLFNTTDASEIIERINKLTPETQRQWGKMNVAQMLSHCQVPMKGAFNEMKIKRIPLGIFLGWLLKKGIMVEEPVRKNLPTGKEFIISDSRDFHKEKEVLVALINRFTQEGEAGIKNNVHCFFGKLSTEQWGVLMYKHLNHHLTQFGC